MPNKTLYVRESDLALWDLAQAQLGQNMSAMFAEFLRERVSIMNAYVHVVRSAPNSQELVVMLNPVGPTGSGGPGNPHYVKEGQLSAFLEGQGVADRVATKLASDLRGAQRVSELTSIPAFPEPNVEFQTEIAAGEGYFGGLGDRNLLAGGPHWLVVMQPQTYVKSRIPTAVDLQRRVQSSAISLRGWTFPIVGRVSASQWENFDGGSQSFHEGRRDRPEAIRAYRSGLVMWCAGLGEEYWQGLEGQNALSFIGAIYSTTEWVLFAKRYFESFLPVEEEVRLDVTLAGAKDRMLVSADPRVSFLPHYRSGVDLIHAEEILSDSQLRADPEAAARRIVRRIFELFNWNDPDEQMLHQWQQDLIRRRS